MAALQVESLASHLARPLIVADVGCRSGFPDCWLDLGQCVLLYGFDADVDEVERLARELAHHSNMHFTATALGAAHGEATLYKTKERGASSLHRPAYDASAHLKEWPGWAIESAVSTPVTTLDAWAASEGVSRIDAIKIDTQGSELDVLRGADDLLERVRHVEVEVSFNETSEGAPLFGQVDAHLRARGFALWKLRDIVSYALADALDAPPTIEQVWYDSVPRNLPLPSGQLSWCNAHYVKREMYQRDARTDWESRLRDACIAIVQRFPDLATVALKGLLHWNDCPGAVRRDARLVLPTLTGQTGHH